MMSIQDKPQDSSPERNSSPTQREARLRALIEHSHEVSLLLDDQGTILYASPALTHVLGYLPEEISGQAMLSWVHPLDQSEASENIASLQAHTRQKLFTTQRYRHKDGSWRWLELRAVNKLADPQVAALICSLRDITTLKDAEIEQQRLVEESDLAHTHLLTVLQQMPAGVMIAEAPSGKLLLSNDQVRQIWHHSFPEANEVDKYDRYKGFHSDGTPYAGYEWPLARSIRQGESVREEEITFLRGDGTRGIMSVSSAPILNTQNEIIAGVVVFIDISERKRLEQLKDNFISMVSHELKTPVTSIKGYTQLLQKHFQRSDEKQSLYFLAKMNYQLDKLTDLINEILSISQLDLGMLNLRPKVFDLVEVVREELESQQATTATHKLQLKGVEKLTITGDCERIGQVIHHLVSNAIKYSPGRKQVCIEICHSDQAALIHIQDYGIGIDSEHFSRLFERFYRVDEPLEQTFPGLGIGLYLAHEIIQRHQGHIWVESQKGQGSTFSFSLPLQPHTAIAKETSHDNH
ncbi:PAS domain S-box protein [Ktedonobacter racemifer]|uniref:histidine kinase n=1 Tax=Ktedonobacter racemifer DSM 44963 TaxID=485913 RepID=D6U4Z3_KTERA|nr:PAS domain S-box protein [Ktedonobacter racemifer]EFH81573.1 PAS/PAC sensor signal transduction histidine kinase [Ktedonobacter racemifer DSM 44963]